jgi:hypothetical protein
MRLNINLATSPYEDAREFWVRWGSAVAVLALITVALLGWTTRSWLLAKRDRHNIAELRQLISSRDQERMQAQAFLGMPVNHSTREQSQFLNGLIHRKSFSWTLVFEDLEQVMPPNLHVVSLRPEFNEQNEMQLAMRVLGDNRSAAVDLVHRMEGSARFRTAQLVAESETTENGGGVIATVVATYIPQEAKPQDSKPEEAKLQETKPAESKEMKPPETKPKVAQPQGAKPPGAKPQEVRPQGAKGSGN